MLVELSVVSILNKVDFPEFGSPKNTHCMSPFLIPSFVLFPDFFLRSTPSFNLFNLLVRFFLMFSEDLCFGHSFIMISRHVILSSSVVATWKSCSAL